MRQRRDIEFTVLDQFTARRLAREIGGEAVFGNGQWTITKGDVPVRVYRDEHGELTLSWRTRNRRSMERKARDVNVQQ